MSSSAVSKPADQLPSILKRPLASRDDYEMRVGPGWTLNDGTYNHIRQTKRRKRDTPCPSYATQAFESMYGLTSLQLAHNAPITLCAMDIAVEHLWRCLPQEVQPLVEIVPPNGPELWSTDDNVAKEVYNRMDKDMARKKTDTYKYYSNLKEKPWAIWPVWVEDEFGSDWVMIVWYSQESQPSSGVYDQLRAYNVYDPRRSLKPSKNNQDGKCDIFFQRSSRIQTRLLEFLGRGGFNTEEAHWSNAKMCPMIAGEHTSGERVFAAVKDMLSYILDNYIEGVDFDPDKEYLPWLHRWINPYGSRIEMAGINAWVLMSTFDYNARIVVECLEPEMKTDIVVDGERRVIKPYALAGPYERPSIAEEDYCTEPSAEKPST
ncbi:hypothetical protein F4805DRAFT_418765 [Annulohypoxylon moriforme]|nr:hypothetical protein F4805DRAFT_418765 [Annulohypoxylon moriforme]